MSSNTWPDGYDRIVLRETDSTMAEIRRRRADLSGPTWVLALHQTNATGRRGRPWQMPPGNFAASLYLPVAGEAPGHAALRSFVASLALREVVSAQVPGDRVTLKWPNDVLLDGGKLAGILLASDGDGRQVSGLTIGIGVNLAAAPPANEVEAQAFRPTALGVDITPEAFLDALAVSYATFETQFRDLGFAPIRQLWLRHAARLGEVITARTTRDSITGTFETIDVDGNLILQTAKGQVAVPAGDVFF